MRRVFLLAGLVLSCMSTAAASREPGTPIIYQPPASVPPQRGDLAFSRLRSEMIDLRQQAIALQASDGGMLTAEHRDLIQERIDAAYRRYHSTRR